MGTRKNRLGEAVLTCTHNLCFEQKNKKKNKKNSAEFFQFLKLKNLCLLHGQIFVMYVNNRDTDQNAYTKSICWLDSQKFCHLIIEPPRGKTNNVVSEQVRHKPACTSTEECYMLDILDISRRGITLSV